MWFWILLVLAVIAYFVIKSMTGKSSSPDSSSTDAQGSIENSTADAVTSVKESATSAADSAVDSASAASGAVTGATAAAASAVAAGAGAMAGAAANDTAAAAQNATSTIKASAAEATAKASQMVSNLPDLSVNSENASSDIQEMIKILNLAAPDAGRLGVSKETFAALRAGTDVSADDISGVADKLRHMLA